MYKRKLSIPVIVLCICILIASFLLIREIIILKGNLDNISMVNNEIDGLNEKLIYLKGYEQRADEMLGMLDKYRRALPETPEEGNIILGLSKLASENSIELGEIRFDEGTQEETLAKLPFHVNASGEYFDLVKFIVGIKDNERIFVIREVNIERNDDSQKLIADINIVAYNIRK
ncbi:MAG TPA: type 4a pilus biogenesis protein PilO [Clostridiales bacterium]|nr:type 4a pilus biogenesis protein PilO [Clostridiales bacterium]